MTRKDRRHGWPAMAGAGMLMVVTLTACGSSGSGSAGATPTQTGGTSSRLSQLASCMGQHGVTIAEPVSASAVRNALKNAPQAERRAALSACRQYLGGGLLSLGTASS